MFKRILVFSLILTSCQSTMGPKPPTKPFVLTQKHAEIIQQGVRNALKDPDSAKFGRIAGAEAADKPGIVYVCGTVNAKNSFGGFTGDKPYVGVLGAIDSEGKTIGVFNVLSFGSTKNDQEVVTAMCAHYGVIGY